MPSIEPVKQVAARAAADRLMGAATPYRRVAAVAMLALAAAGAIGMHAIRRSGE